MHHALLREDLIQFHDQRSFRETVTSVWPGANETLVDQDMDANYTLTPPGHEETYSVDRETYNGMASYVYTIFQVSIGSSFASEASVIDAYDGLDMSQALYTEMTSRLGANQTIFTEPLGSKQGVFTYTIPTTGVPDRLFERIATSLTAQMRRNADTSWAVLGDALSVQTFVEARWIWAILPITLLLLTIIFVVSTITASVSRGVPAWKSSSLAILLHGLDEQSCQALTACYGEQCG